MLIARRRLLQGGTAIAASLWSHPAPALLKGTYQGPLTNVASRGTLVSNTGTTSGAKTRFKARLQYRTGASGLKTVTVVYCNWGLGGSSGEFDGPNGITLSNVAIEINGIAAPVTRLGNQTFTIAIGATVVCDEIPATAFGYTNDIIPKNTTAFVRSLYDLTAGQSFPGDGVYNLTDVAYRYDPAQGSNDVYATGPMAAPAGADLNGSFFAPVCLAGRYATATGSPLGLGDSIIFGQNDVTGTGNASGGHFWRGCWDAGVAGFLMAQVNSQAAYWAVDHSRRSALISTLHFTYAINAFGWNDVNNALNAFANCNVVSQDCKTAGVLKVAQALITPRTNTAAQTFWANSAGQSPVGNFVNGGLRDTTNTAFLGAVGGGIIDRIYDMSAWNDPLDHTLFGRHSFSTTIASNYTAGQTSIVLTDQPPVNFVLIPDTTPFDVNGPLTASAISGSGPYTATLLQASSFAASYPAGTPIIGIVTVDGVHGKYTSYEMIAAAPVNAALYASFAGPP